jgi:hypothetical protein
MHPMKSLKIFTQLLRTLLDLNQLPLPLGTTLDPRNIIMDGDHPYLLFIHVKHFSPFQEDERWRELLFFLLTGERPVRNGLEKQWERVKNRIPPEMQPLVRDCFDKDKSIKEILSKASNIQWKRPRVQTRRFSKRLVSSAAMAAILVFGAFVGQQITTNASLENKPVMSKQRVVVDHPFSAKQFDGSGSYLPISLKAADGAWIRFHVSVPNGGWPLAVRLGSTADARTVTILNENGPITGIADSVQEPLFWTVWQPVDTGAYEARMEILLLPHQPVQIRLSDPEGKWKWMTAAPPMNTIPSQLSLLGGEGVSVTEGVVRSLSDSGQKASSWNEGRSWSLVQGEALMEEGKWTLGENSVATVRPDEPVSLTFHPSSGRQTQLVMEWQTKQGDPLRLVVKSNGMTLYRMGRHPVQLQKCSFNHRLRPGRNVFVSVFVSATGKLMIHLQQGRNVVMLTQPLDSIQLSSAKVIVKNRTVLTETPQASPQ